MILIIEPFRVPCQTMEGTIFIENGGEKKAQSLASVLVEKTTSTSTHREDNVMFIRGDNEDTCGVTGIKYGSKTINERGYSLASAGDGLHFYMAGLKGDSVMVVKASVSGSIEWVRTFDIVPNEEDHVTSILLDQEGMLAVAGTSATWPGGGSAFAFRYNPVTHQILWSKQYNNTQLNYCFGLALNEQNGNYIMTSSVSLSNERFMDAEVVEINRATGNINTAAAKMYHIGAADDYSDIDFHQGFIYACGRFTVGADNSLMRSCLTKLNPNDGSVVWSKSGHKSLSGLARLYGRDLIVDNGFVYSVSHGDPDGASLSDINLYVQKTDIHGELIWVNQYQLPGNVDIGYEIIKSGDGYIVFAHKRSNNGYLVLFKIDPNGAVEWATRYIFNNPVNSSISHTAKSQLIQVGDHLVFTAFTTDGQDNEDVVLVRTDLSGFTDIPCVTSETFSIQVSPVPQATLFNQVPQVNDVLPQQSNPGSTSGMSILTITEDCFVSDTIFTEIDTIICQGSQYFGYGIEGTYVDAFTSSGGCDSIRTLNLQTQLEVFSLDMNICEGESFEDYTETGVYSDTIYGQDGSCDALRILTLSIIPTLVTIIDAAVCEGLDYFGHTIQGVYTDTLVSSLGCDSIRTVSLSIVTPSLSFIEASICDPLDHNYSQPGIYTDTLISISGCDSIRTWVLQSSPIYIPNVISPNGDGINDEFRIFTPGDQPLNVSYFAMFDRMGNMCYETFKWPVAWNGKGKTGQFYNPGVFAYVFSYICNENKITKTGNVTIIR